MDPEAYELHAAVEERHWWFAGRRAIAESVIAGLALPSPARLVELGSGTGGNLAMLRRFGDVVAIEPNDGARAASEARAPWATHVQRIAELAGPAFDAAFAFDVLEHLADPPRDLAALGAWLAPRAPLIVTVPAHPWLFGAHDVYLHHHRRYTAAALAADLAHGGFEVDSVMPINATVFPAAVVARGVEWVRDRVVGARRGPRGMSVPPPLLNRALAATFGGERHALGRLPFGLSLLAVAHLGSR